MRSLRAQRGISPVGWIGLLIVIGFVSLVAIRIVPAYVDYYAVVSSARSVHADATNTDAAVPEMRESLRKHLQINDVDDLGEDIITIKRGRGTLEFVIDYEVRKHLLWNMDLVLRFNRRIGA